MRIGVRDVERCSRFGCDAVLGCAVRFIERYTLVVGYTTYAR